MATSPEINKQPNQPDDPKKQPPSPADEHGPTSELQSEKSAPGEELPSSGNPTP